MILGGATGSYNNTDYGRNYDMVIFISSQSFFLPTFLLL